MGVGSPELSKQVEAMMIELTQNLHLNEGMALRARDAFVDATRLLTFSPVGLDTPEFISDTSNVVMFSS